MSNLGHGNRSLNKRTQGEIFVFLSIIRSIKVGIIRRFVASSVPSYSDEEFRLGFSTFDLGGFGKLFAALKDG